MGDDRYDVIIVGAGPAGIFAAIELIHMRPVCGYSCSSGVSRSRSARAPRARPHA